MSILSQKLLKMLDSKTETKRASVRPEMHGPLLQLLGRNHIDSFVPSSMNMSSATLSEGHNAANMFYRLLPSHVDRNDYQFDLKPDMDLLRSCHLMINKPSRMSMSIDNYIDEVEIFAKIKDADEPSQGHLVQIVSGRALQFDSTVFQRTKICLTEEKVIIPLHLLFSANWLPMISMAHQTLHIRIRMQEGIEFADMALIVCATLINDHSRRYLCRPRDHVIWLPQCMTYSAVGGTVEIDLVKIRGLSCIREIFVQIQSPEEDRLDLLQDFAPRPLSSMVKTANIFLQGKRLYDDIPIEYFTETVTKQLYGLVSDDTFVLPIDLTPLQENPSSTLNIFRLNEAKIKMELKPGNYEVTIFVRSVNVLVFCDGICGWKFNM